MHPFSKLIPLLLLISTALNAQDSEISKFADAGLKMTFPGIYFKANSTEYEAMPYSVDSCLKYISLHFKENIHNLDLWRDSLETEKLSYERMRKLKADLRKYIPSGDIPIHSMGNEQKIPRQTINATTGSAKMYLLSLNSVFDFSRTRFPPEKKKQRRYLVWTGWRTGFHWNTP